MTDLDQALAEANDAVAKLAKAMPDVKLRQSDMVVVSVGCLNALVAAISTSGEVIDALTAGPGRPTQTGMRIGFDGKLSALMSDGSQSPVYFFPDAEGKPE